MATLDFTGAVQRRHEGPWPSAVFQLYNKLDFSRNNGGSADVIQALPVKAGTWVYAVAHIVLTAEGGTSTGTIGDGDDADGWIASVNNNAAANTALFSNGKFTLAEGAPNTITYTHAYGAAGGVYYAADDTIDMTLSANAVDTAVIAMAALCVEIAV